MPRRQGMTRRGFLRRTAAAALAAAGGPVLKSLASAAAPAGRAKAGRAARAQAAVIVRFGGGVRFSEMWSPAGMANIPFLARLAREGAFFPRMYNRGRADQLGGTYHLLTGAYAWPEWGKRPELPTLFEYAVKHALWTNDDGLVINHGWESTFVTFSSHRDYGVQFGAARVSQDLVEIERLERELRRRDLTKDERPGVEGRLTHYRGQEKRAHDLGDQALPAERGPRMVRYVRALASGSVPRGFAPHGDDLATHFAIEALGVVAPRALFLPLSSPEAAASGRWSAYINAIRRLDVLVAHLYAAVQANDRYRGRTVFVVCPDRGRCDDGHGAAGFQHSDGADEGVKRLGCVIEGPGVKSGAVIDRPCEQIDVLPTLADLLGFEAPLAQGQVLKEALR